MQKNCLNCGSSFEITQDDLAFYKKVSPAFLGKKYPIPSPTLCPPCRQQRRLAYRNERTFYHRTCDKTGAEIISIYPQKSIFTVFDTDVWWGDSWDPLDHERKFDFSRPFFEQFVELRKQVPRPCLYAKANQNSTYTNHCSHAKNCYLSADVAYVEDILYSKYIIRGNNNTDCYMTNDSEYCYETLYTKGYHSSFTQQCEDVRDSWFLYDCKNCDHCLFCWNLRSKDYYIRNNKCTKEEFEKELESLQLHTYSGLEKAKREFSTLVMNAIRKPSILINSDECSGGAVRNSKNAKLCFDVSNARDCKYCHTCDGLNDCWDTFESAFDCELQYEGYACNNGKRLIATMISYDVQDIMYSDVCHNSSHLFGCIGLRHKQYCILNKQYSKEEYEELVPKIINHMTETGEWGEFFPIKFSPFGYNETVAPEFFPLSKEEVEPKGWKWKDRIDDIPKVDKIIPAAKLPDSIDDIPDDILNWAIECKLTGRPFRIVKPELAFYRKMRLPIPHLHPDERHKNRMAIRDPSTLWKRTCAQCSKEFQTTYAPQRPEIVYCEECYLKEVY